MSLKCSFTASNRLLDGHELVFQASRIRGELLTVMNEPPYSKRFAG
jgi:hypothetical protein